MTEASYLENTRGIDPDRAARYGVEVKPLRRGGLGVTIAYRRNGEVYGHKIRPLDPGDGPRFFFHPKGARRDLWNVDCLGDGTLADQPVILAEGELDAMSCVEAGFPRSVSIPDGWSVNCDGGDGPKSKPILDNLDRLRKSPFVIAAGDGDGTGASFTRAVANLLDGHPVKFLDYPDGCKDANDILRRHGPGELARVINAARWMEPEGGRITGFADLPPQPPMQLYRPDFPPLDSVLLFHAGHMTVITGVPSMGKSTLATFALHHVVRANGIRVGVAMFETPPAVLRDHLARLSTGTPWDYLPADAKKALTLKLDRNWRIIHKVDTDRRAHDMGWIRDMMHAAAVRDGCKVVMFDPWNEIDHAPERGESMALYTNAALARIRQWAERFDCAVCILAHPTKMQSHPGHEPEPPLGYDISDAAAWYNKAAIGVTVHQATKNDEPVTTIINWKSKFQQSYGFGRGRVHLDFDKSAMAYRQRVHS